MTPVEFFHSLSDSHKMKEMELKVVVESNTRTAWETTRVTLLHLYGMNPHIKKKPKTVYDVFKLDWDKQEIKIQTTEEMTVAVMAIHRAFQKKPNKAVLSDSKRRKSKNNTNI